MGNQRTHADRVVKQQQPDRSSGSQGRSVTSREEKLRRNNCPECDGQLITSEHRAERSCEDCGLVVDADKIDPGPEWRSFDDTESDRRRTGAPLDPLRINKGMTTSVGHSDRDGYGNQLSSSRAIRMARLRKLETQFKRTDQESQFGMATGEIQRMGSALGVPKEPQETAAVIFKRCQEESLLPGRSIEGMATAAFYIALRKAEIPRSLSEIEPVSRVKQQEFARAYNYICAELDIALEPPKVDTFIKRFAANLDAPEQVVQRAQGLVNNTPGHQTAGRHPNVLAGAAVYAASVLENTIIPQSDIAEIAEITTVSLRHNWRELLKYGSDVNLPFDPTDANLLRITDHLHRGRNYHIDRFGPSSENVTEETDEAIPCSECDDTFKTPAAAASHEANIHRNRTPIREIRKDAGSDIHQYLLDQLDKSVEDSVITPPEEVIATAKQTIRATPTDKFTGNEKIETTLGGIVYAAVHEHGNMNDVEMTQEDIADLTDSSPSTISQSYDQFLPGVRDALNES